MDLGMGWGMVVAWLRWEHGWCKGKGDDEG